MQLIFSKKTQIFVIVGKKTTTLYFCNKKPALLSKRVDLAGGLGFEPRLVESESDVLPLDDPPVGGTHYRPVKN